MMLSDSIYTMDGEEIDADRGSKRARSSESQLFSSIDTQSFAQWLLHVDVREVSEQLAQNVNVLEQLAEKLKALSAALEQQRQGPVSDLRALVQLRERASVAYIPSEADEDEFDGKEVLANFVVGPKRAGLRVHAIYRRDVEGGFPQWSITCGGCLTAKSDSSTYLEADWKFHADEVEKLLRESGIARFGDTHGAEVDCSGDGVTEGAIAAFIAALMARVYEEIGHEDEYGLGLGWGPRLVGYALSQATLRPGANGAIGAAQQCTVSE